MNIENLSIKELKQLLAQVNHDLKMNKPTIKRIKQEKPPVLSDYDIGDNASVIIPIDTPFPPGVSYAISIEPNQATLTFVEKATKLSNQFTLNIAAHDASTACDIIIRRQ